MANNFKPWVDTPTPGQQVQTAEVFAEDEQRKNGFKAGDPASALRVNSALRQANIVVAGLMEFCDEANTLPDDLSLLSTVTEVKNAIKDSVEALHNTTLTSAKEYTDTRETAIDARIANKVDKEDGKVLSENDLTDELKGNYDTAYSHSQQIGNPHETEIPEIDKTNNLLIGDGNGNAIDSEISASMIANSISTTTLFKSDTGVGGSWSGYTGTYNWITILSGVDIRGKKLLIYSGSGADATAYQHTGHTIVIPKSSSIYTLFTDDYISADGLMSKNSIVLRYTSSGGLQMSSKPRYVKVDTSTGLFINDTTTYPNARVSRYVYAIYQIND